MDGDVSAVRAEELGADMKGSLTRRSWGETVPKFDAELETLPAKSNEVGIAGEEKAVWPSPSKGTNSPKSTSAAFIILAVGTLPVL
jgi:hypothetical protein